MSVALIFPGQGSQFVGMGKELYDAFRSARDTFQEVDDALHQKLSHLLFHGPEAHLNLTENTQPALMAVSMAVINVLAKDFDYPASSAQMAAGHSLGEYSALAACGVISLADTARLLKRRGQAMQAAVPLGKGTMAALLGLSHEAATGVTKKATEGLNPEELCVVANDNCEGQLVISGNTHAVEKAMALALEHGAKRCIPLSVSAPFHCPLMQPAAHAMSEALAQVTFAPPRIPVVSNVTAQAESHPDRLKSLLVEQITHAVRWRESVMYMADRGIDTYLEVGAGQVLTGLVKRIQPSAQRFNLNTPSSIEAYIKGIS